MGRIKSQNYVYLALQDASKLLGTEMQEEEHVSVEELFDVLEYHGTAERELNRSGIPYHSCPTERMTITIDVGNHPNYYKLYDALMCETMTFTLIVGLKKNDAIITRKENSIKIDGYVVGVEERCEVDMSLKSRDAHDDMMSNPFPGTDKRILMTIEILVVQAEIENDAGLTK